MKLDGLTALTTGVGFHKVTSLVPAAFESAADVASIVIVFGLGSTAGAVYIPLLIVPVLALPPATPFTDQVTF